MKEEWLEIVNNFGLDEQIKHWFTEIYELVQAIERDDGSIESKQKITSELADNYNFLKQIQFSYEITDEEVITEQQFKNKRTLMEMKGKKPIQELKNKRFTRNQKQIAGKINEVIRALNELKEK